MKIYYKIITLIFFAFCQIQGQIVINEILASNLNYREDNYGDYDDLIELHNTTNDTINLEGYFLSDNQDDLTKWAFPYNDSLFVLLPQDYVILWADNESFQGQDHLSFNFSKDGESIFFVSPNGSTIIDQKSFPKQFADISYGRDVLNNNDWSYFISPTIGTQNSIGFEGVLEMPTLTPQGGVSAQMTLVSMINNNSVGDIYYTLDGGIPTTNDLIYENQINILSTTVINGKSFNNNFIPSYSNSHLYLVDDYYSLPIIAVLSDPLNFWNDSIGIYINYWDEGILWERRNNIQYFSNDSLFFSNSSGIRIQGRSSRSRAKKSFRLFYKNAYGQSRLDYPIFHGEGPSSFKNLVLRSGYDDDIQMTTGTLIRDPLVSEIWEDLGMLSSRSIFSNLFINEQYWGIYNIRESINEHFISDHKGYLDFDLIRYLKNNIDLKFGTLEEWSSINNFIRESDFSLNINYEEALNRIDIENFLNLQALIICSEYRSWGWGASVFRERVHTGKWEWTIWDMDRAFTNVNWNGFTYLNDTTGLEAPNALAFQLLKNDQFKYDYINRISDFLNTHFKPENLIAKIDSLKSLLEDDIVFEADRWNRTVATWENNISLLRSFASSRPNIVRQQLINYFSLEGSSELSITTNEGGSIKVNSVLVNESPFNGIYFKNIPISLEAIPLPGYVFDRWISDDDFETNPIIIDIDSDILNISAVFSPVNIDNELEIISPSISLNDDFHPLVFKYYDQGSIRMNNEPMKGHLYVNDVAYDSVVVIKKGVGTYLLNVENIERPIIVSIEINNERSSDIILSENNETFIDTVSGSISNRDSIWEENSTIFVNSDLFIDAGSHLAIQAGVQVILDEHVNIIVNGSMSINGVEENPIIFKSKNRENPWGGIEFYNSISNIDNCFFINGGSDPNKGWAHTNTQPILFAKENSILNINHSYLLFSPGKALGAHTSQVNVDNTIISFVFHGGEFHYTTLVFDHSYVMNIPNDDGVFVDDDNDGFHIDYRHPEINKASVIKNSFFITGKDDAIDHHKARIDIENCWIEDWMNEGVAASGSDTIKVTNTIAKGCFKGFEAGHGAPTIIINHSLAIDNNQGFRFGDSYSTPNTGKMIVTNSIAFDNQDNVKNYTNHLSGPYSGGLDISFSITNDAVYDTISNNLSGEPLFDSSFRTLYGSLGSSLGQNGRNIGVIDYNSLHYGQVIINEIMYKSSSDFDSEDWIELFNPGSDTVDVSSWVVKDNDNDHIFVLPDSHFIPGGSYLVISKDVDAFQSVYNHTSQLVGDMPFGLGQGDQVRIYSSIMMLVDSLEYDNNNPWPPLSNNYGPSIELINIENNLLPENWSASLSIGGTPGIENSGSSLNILNEKTIIPTDVVLSQNYPNPFNPKTTIFYMLPKYNFVNITIYDVAGKIVKTLVNSEQDPGQKFVNWNSENMKNELVSSGMYIYVIKVGDFIDSKKMMLIK